MLASGTVSTVAAGYVPAMMFVGLFLLGLGWSVCLIAGTTLLTGSVPAESRVEAQGTGDLTLSLCGAVAAFGSGFVKQSLGFHLLAHAATAIMAALLVATWLSAARHVPAPLAVSPNSAVSNGDHLYIAGMRRVTTECRADGDRTGPGRVRWRRHRGRRRRRKRRRHDLRRWSTSPIHRSPPILPTSPPIPPTSAPTTLWPPDDTSAPTATDQPAPSGSDCGLTTEQVSSVMGIDHGSARRNVRLGGAQVGRARSSRSTCQAATPRCSPTADGDEVAGVGDEARFDFLDVLNFRIGDSFYYVQVLNMGGASHDLVPRRVRRTGEAVGRVARLTSRA